MKKIYTMNKKEATDFKSNANWVAIQIGNFDGDWPELSTFNRLDLLQLFFLDVESDKYKNFAEKRNSALFEDNHAKQIIDFTDYYWDKVDCFLIHCTAGISRSPAIAAAIQKHHNIDNQIWFNIKKPNMRVYNSILKLSDFYKLPNHQLNL